ncbi:hypothetical protein [Streptomyces noursei]|uniref:hypothetical protein n=1 Tax=Streptomyces noursei TaxID=1971 RepID=UPI00382E5383
MSGTTISPQDLAERGIDLADFESPAALYLDLTLLGDWDGRLAVIPNGKTWVYLVGKDEATEYDTKDEAVAAMNEDVQEVLGPAFAHAASHDSSEIDRNYAPLCWSADNATYVGLLNLNGEAVIAWSTPTESGWTNTLPTLREATTIAEQIAGTLEDKQLAETLHDEVDLAHFYAIADNGIAAVTEAYGTVEIEGVEPPSGSDFAPAPFVVRTSRHWVVVSTVHGIHDEYFPSSTAAGAARALLSSIAKQCSRNPDTRGFSWQGLGGDYVVVAQHESGAYLMMCNLGSVVRLETWADDMTGANVAAAAALADYAANTPAQLTENATASTTTAYIDANAARRKVLRAQLEAVELALGMGLRHAQGTKMYGRYVNGPRWDDVATTLEVHRDTLDQIRKGKAWPNPDRT